MNETMLERFLKVKNYNDVNEVDSFAKHEMKLLKGDLPTKFTDMTAMSILSDRFYMNVPEKVVEEMDTGDNGEVPEFLALMEKYRVIEERFVTNANWSDIVLGNPDADLLRQFAWSLIDEYHKIGWTVIISSVRMESGEPYEYGEISPDDDTEDYKMEYLSLLNCLFMDLGEEMSTQILLKDPDGCIRKAFVVVNCLWAEGADGYMDVDEGPFIVSGQSKDGLEMLAPKDIGFPILSCGENVG